jgi:general secretion pathway protein K
MSARLRHQRGVAVITALLLTTLAITIVASLFWQQQVQVRSIENQRLQLQKQWILRGALDWTRLILREDARITSQVDHLGEPWAVPLAETRLEEYVEKERAGEVPDAALSGGIEDAMGRFNLRNLCPGGTISKPDVEIFAKLLTSQQINPSLAEATANLMAAAQRKATPGAPVDSGAPQPMNIEHVDDLLAVPGFTPEALDKIKDFIVVLSVRTEINANTASAEVLSARIATLSLADARGVVANRQKAWFTKKEDLQSQLPSGVNAPDGIRFNSEYFLVNGNVRLNRAGMEMQALVQRPPQGNPSVVWIREH